LKTIPKSKKKKKRKAIITTCRTALAQQTSVVKKEGAVSKECQREKGERKRREKPLSSTLKFVTDTQVISTTIYTYTNKYTPTPNPRDTAHSIIPSRPTNRREGLAALSTPLTSTIVAYWVPHWLSDTAAAPGYVLASSSEVLLA